MSKPKQVTGQECLEYINKPLGFANKLWNTFNNIYNDDNTQHSASMRIKSDSVVTQVYTNAQFISNICKISHDRTKRIVGVVKKKYDDGGLQIHILGDETLTFGRGTPEISTQPIFNASVRYVVTLGVYNINNETFGYSEDGINGVTGNHLTNEQIEYYEPSFAGGLVSGNTWYRELIRTNGHAPASSNESELPVSTDINNTLIYGVGREFGVNGWDIKIPLSKYNRNNPLQLIGGALHSFFFDICYAGFQSNTPGVFNDASQYNNFVEYPADTKFCESLNGVSLIYNLILTESQNQALNYLTNGVLPSDAWLYPLDFDNLPLYDESQRPDDDDDDGGDPDDDGNNDRDVDPTPLVVPYIVPSMFNANNVYWLGIGEFMQFLTWFWYDIQQFSILDPTTWDNLLDNINGLYANLASAVISVRYMPVDEDWIGGLGDDEPIKLAQVQKTGNVNTISTLNQPPIEHIGSINITGDFDSFLDLPPYSSLTLYLPYYGYVDLDIDIFNGHSLDVYAVYDVLSGTIQYFVYYDDTFMVNQYVAKISVDVPITLQSAYDRDRTIQQNVATALSGFMSAGAGAMSGNPIGAVIGIQSLNSAVSPQNTAPIKVEGIGAEQGQLYAPSKCAIILRRPTTTNKGKAFAQDIGNLWCKSAKLNDPNLSLTGFTVCANPRINFKGVEYVDEEGHATGIMILPLETEVEEIYNYMKEGVIL